MFPAMLRPFRQQILFAGVGSSNGLISWITIAELVVRFSVPGHSGHGATCSLLKLCLLVTQNISFISIEALHNR